MYSTSKQITADLLTSEDLLQGVSGSTGNYPSHTRQGWVGGAGEVGHR